jgi:uncharacterized protein YcsI (UPF0317 family)
MTSAVSRDLISSLQRDGAAVRRACRSGAWSGTTAGLAPGYMQGNLVVVPRSLAEDFLRFAQRNPRPCPIVGMTDASQWTVPALGVDLDLRTDLPRYRVWRRGELIDEPTDVVKYWRDDLVGFVIGCSFSFEEALLAEGVPLRHVAQGKNVAMFRTSIACQPAGPFSGPLVVSMRPLTPADAIRAVQITSRFPAVHGAPIHLGFPEAIGITDLQTPDYGDAVEIKPGELPVFWACGVTPQAVIAAARPEFAITHAPGAMLVTDLLNSRLAAL